MSVSYFTICSRNYLAYARALHDSLRRCDPVAARNFHLILADEPLPCDEEATLGFPVILARSLGIANFWDMAMRYDVMELNTAVKAHAFLHLLDRDGVTGVVYLDPDIFVLRGLHEVHGLLERGTNLVLTPHALEPLEDGRDPDDLRLLRTGGFNLGFCAVRNSAESRTFLAWWARRLVEYCHVDLASGLFVDQKFMDLAPSYLPNTHILRHPGYNVAYWNLLHRPVSLDGQRWRAGEADLCFFHFSGVVPDRIDIFSKHQNRFCVRTIGPALAALLEQYLSTLEACGHSHYRQMPYAYGFFSNGQPIPSIVRRAYAVTHPPGPRDFSDVFACDLPFCDAPSSNYRIDTLRPVTVLMEEIWKQRPDLQAQFSLHERQGREMMARWLLSSGVLEYQLPAEAVHSVSRAMQFLEARGRLSQAALPGHFLLRHRHHLHWAYRHLSPGLRQVFKRAILKNSGSAPPPLTPPATASGSIKPELKDGLCVAGYLAAPTGVGEGARRALLAAQTTNLDVSAFSVFSETDDGSLLEPFVGLIQRNRRSRFLLLHMNADQVLHADKALPRSLFDGRYRIAYWAWELSSFPDPWKDAFSFVDEVWVPSRFVGGAVKRATSKPVHVVPHAIPGTAASVVNREAMGLPEDAYVFLTAADLDSFISRKNPIGAIHAFQKAFPPISATKGPFLLVKCHGKGKRNDRERLKAAIGSDPRIRLIDRTLPPEENASLKACCDAFISLHRSEGFGLNLAESMALGKPVIATDYGGSTDFLDETTGFPLGYQLRSLQPGEYPHGETSRWAEPDLDEAVRVMRLLVSDPALGARVGAFAAEQITARFSLNCVGALMAKRLTELGLDP